VLFGKRRVFGAVASLRWLASQSDIGPIPTEGTNKSAVSRLSLITRAVLSPAVSFPGILIDVLATHGRRSIRHFGNQQKNRSIAII
jgi:hypothetical protein